MLRPKRIIVPEKTRVCQHPDAMLGEVWVTNKPTEVAFQFAEQHKYRIGTTSYNKISAVVPDFQPVFAPADPDVSHTCLGYCNQKK
jgi:hypothetical protein